MKITHFPLLLLLSGMICLVQCKSASTDETKTTEDKTGSTSGDSTAALPYLTMSDINILYTATEKTDMIFYNLPISVSQDDPPSAKNTSLYISPAAPDIKNTCQPLGRLTWLANGKILREADFYSENGCHYLVFMENNKPAYMNAMSPEGVQFLTTLLSQVKPKPAE